MSSHPTPMSIIERLHGAMNQHDLDAFVACFDTAYKSEQPLHPDRAFTGNSQVRKNWSQIFSSVPDFHSDLLRTSVSGDSIWSEWRWSGSRVDKTVFDMRGTIIFGTQNGKITWGRLYMEPVEANGTGIDASVKNLTGGAE
jgi:limonene-1,2-epoxide hydrolase